MAVVLQEVAYRVLPRVLAGRSLADSEWRTLVRAAESLLEGRALSADSERVADSAERFLAAGRSSSAWRVRVLLTLIEFVPLLHGRAPFSALGLAERRAWIEERWTGGGVVASLCARLRLLVLIGAYGDARAPHDAGVVPLVLRTAESKRGFVRPAVP